MFQMSEANLATCYWLSRLRKERPGGLRVSSGPATLPSPGTGHAPLPGRQPSWALLLQVLKICLLSPPLGAAELRIRFHAHN